MYKLVLWMNVVIMVSLTSRFIYKLYKTKLNKVNRKTCVLITGCDSGLGYSFARHCQELGMTVFSCVLNENSDGAKDLKQRGNSMHVFGLDITDRQSIINLQGNIENIVTSQQYDLIGMINNAGIMIFGEFEWLTEQQIANQMNVNFLGTVYLTKAFIPLLRKFKGRIINISSHCSIVPLPALSVYAASKAAIDAWSSSLRMELDKFGIKVITLKPGSYTAQSHIMLNQELHKETMLKEMSPENLYLYKDYFERFHSYLKSVACTKQLTYIQDKNLMTKLDMCLLSNNPRSAYSNSPIRYKIYHSIIRTSPCIYIRDYFINRYVNLPKWKC